jgi:hypothetical protein
MIVPLLQEPLGEVGADSGDDRRMEAAPPTNLLQS